MDYVSEVFKVLDRYCISPDNLESLIQHYHKLRDSVGMDSIDSKQNGMSYGDIENENYKLRTIVEYLERKLKEQE